MIQSYLNNYDVEFDEISSGTSLSTHKEAGNCQLKSFLCHERNIYVQILPFIRTNNEVTEEYGLFLTVRFKAFSSFLQVIPSHSNSVQTPGKPMHLKVFNTVNVTVKCRCKIIFIHRKYSILVRLKVTVYFNNLTLYI